MLFNVIHSVVPTPSTSTILLTIGSISQKLKGGVDVHMPKISKFLFQIMDNFDVTTGIPKGNFIRAFNGIFFSLYIILLYSY